ncbi:4-hydroxyphenylpyruvate dioxygenase [Crenothrix sp.]|uniref:4-hydroxyphenylpyruvate dioxygenase n=1 Tax=Crenothrix sp. TaxID=3100433 RepID=UPI00374D24B7
MNSASNPVGTDGFEFVEYTAEDTRELERLFTKMGFVAIAKHRSKDVVLYRQGEINFIINHEPASFAQAFAKVHGPSICAFAIRVKNAADCLNRVIKLGAQAYYSHIGPMELNIPAIRGIGRSLIYLVDRYGEDHSIYDVDFIPLNGVDSRPKGFGLKEIDHLTHNVFHGGMNKWAEFYQRLFKFREIRYFDIHGKVTGLKSRAMTSPCGKIRIPINEPSDSKSQIQEYLEAYHGEGIQHIALASNDIYATVQQLRDNGIEFMDVPDTYYDAINARVPGHHEAVEQLRNNRILIDGDPASGAGLLLQIFTTTVIGPIFFEIIQRKGNDGFGEGNFQALFEAIELDQIKRGVI